MARPKVNSYLVKYFVRGLVGVEVKAETFEEAKSFTDERMRRDFFASDLEDQNSSVEFAGFDNMTMWDSVDE